ncbi:MAG: RsmB/NOP family class I SAM-dependent RNA methyltransferase [Deltaproteobacteria bacterium]
MSSKANPRSVALRLILAVTIDHALLSDVREKLLAPLEPAERARALSLADGALRDMGKTDRLIGHYMKERPPEFILGVLRLAVHELAGDPEGAHGIVHEAVTLVKAQGAMERYAGLVNAVLRNTIRRPAVVWADMPPSPLPKALRKRLLAVWGKARVGAFEAVHQGLPPVDFTAKRDAAAVATALGGVLLPTGSVRLARAGQVSALPGFAEGEWWVQDAAAALPVQLIDVAPGMVVYDLCAAPGGKTMQLAARGAVVTAVDISERRLKRLSENLTRTGLAAEVITADIAKWRPKALADAVLLDAPCSASGTIRRHPDLPYAKANLEVGGLVQIQTGLLSRAANLVKPGGQVVYATCSLLPEEGEAHVAIFLANNPEFSVDHAALDRVAVTLPSEARVPEGLRTTPEMWADQGGMDGFFMTAFRRAT